MINMLDIRDFINKRILATIALYPFETVKEYKVLEVSPSGDWVKLMIDGKRFWNKRQLITLVEILSDRIDKREKPPED